MRENPKPFEKYMHFKGKCYQIIAIAHHSETKEDMVVYQQLYSPFEVYVRPLDMFMSEVDKIKYPEVSQKYRFEKIDNIAEGEKEKKTESKIENTISKILESEPKKEVTKTETVVEKNEETEELDIDPDVIRFLDAKTYDEKLQILSSIHMKITDDMINIMAVSIDTEVKESDDIERRYAELKNSLIMMERFECNRLR